ncbi:hypothetical protein T4A_3599, partial [Trichinella pseudospiralis]
LGAVGNKPIGETDRIDHSQHPTMPSRFEIHHASSDATVVFVQSNGQSHKVGKWKRSVEDGTW